MSEAANLHADLLIEIGTEELPPAGLMRLADGLRAGLLRGLEQAQLTHGEAQAYASPRRLAVLVEQVAAAQPEQSIERRGPSVAAAFDADDEPTKAALGFAESCNTKVEGLQRLATDKGEWLVYRAETPGKALTELLPSILAAALDGLPIGRRMRWGELTQAFVRPVHWIVALHGDAIVDLELFGIKAGNTSRGHRFLSPEPIELDAPADYAQRLRDAGRVIVDFDERRELIRKQALAAGKQLGGEAVIHEALLDEVTALVEWPVAIGGAFDSQFLQLPREVLIATLEHHQRCFAVESGAELLPAFIAISNIDSGRPELIRAGNERVVRPRLADALFFWRQDLRKPLAEHAQGLDAVAFHEGLGSLADKTRRIAELAKALAAEIRADTDQTERAAALCKADLLTQMVIELPELQGVMGRYYALEAGEDAQVAKAIEEHYLPRRAEDELPQSAVGQCLALADRIDTLVGCFAAGRQPTGEKDPFGLRRASLAVLRILIEGKLGLDLGELFEAAGKPEEKTKQALFEFFYHRLRGYYLERGVSIEVFKAVRATGETRPLAFDKRVEAIRAFLSSAEAQSLSAAHKRVRNILKGAPATGEPEAALLEEEAESDLYRDMVALQHQIKQGLENGDYPAVLSQLAALKAPVDRFFDQVMVMADDRALKENRLALLGKLDGLCRSVADLSELPG